MGILFKKKENLSHYYSRGNAISIMLKIAAKTTKTKAGN